MRAIISSANVQMRQSIARSMFRFCVFVNPLLNAILLGMMYSSQSNEDFTLYALLGTSLSSLWTIICFSSAADISREKFMGTLPIVFVAPVGFKKIMIGKLLGNTLWGVVGFLLNILFVQLIFNRPLKITNFLFLFIFLILSIVVFTSMGMILSALFTLSRVAQLLMNIIEYPLLILTGMVFPLSMLPNVLQKLSYILPPTWIMKGFHLVVYGGNVDEYFFVLGILILSVGIYFVGANFTFDAIEKKCRVRATLEVV